ncbi:MAG TPA: Holliday junction resolvase RuvX [Candidatus Limnocylindrales bacterium]
MSRLLGVDLGERRIGLAVAEADGIVARPLATLSRGAHVAVDVGRLRQIIGREEIAELVVGLPIEAHGSEGRQAAVTREWASGIAKALGLPVVYRDERYTSHVAEERLGPIGRGRSGGPPGRTRRSAYRARVDREAAAIILQDELDARAAAASRTSGAAHRPPTTEQR